MISDMSGKQLSKFQINAIGTGSINLNVANMQPGIYLYTLIVDGVIVDTKKMIIGG